MKRDEKTTELELEKFKVLINEAKEKCYLEIKKNTILPLNSITPLNEDLPIQLHNRINSETPVSNENERGDQKNLIVESLPY